MSVADPKDVVREYVCLPGTPVVSASSQDRAAWNTQQYTGGFGAKAETIIFLKERSAPSRHLYYVTFENEQGKQLQCTCDVIEDSNGVWRMQGIAGGTGCGPQATVARVNLGGGASDQFYAGGYVQHGEDLVTKVCLKTSDGLLLEDSVENNIVLFLDDRCIDVPLQALLYNRQGELIGTHQVFPG